MTPRPTSGTERALQEVGLALLAHDLVLEHVLQSLGATLATGRLDRFLQGLDRLFLAAHQPAKGVFGLAGVAKLGDFGRRLAAEGDDLLDQLRRRSTPRHRRRSAHSPGPVPLGQRGWRRRSSTAGRSGTAGSAPALRRSTAAASSSRSSLSGIALGTRFRACRTRRGVSVIGLRVPGAGWRN